MAEIYQQGLPQVVQLLPETVVLLLQLSDSLLVLSLALAPAGFGFTGGFRVGKGLLMRVAAQGLSADDAVILFLDLGMEVGAPMRLFELRVEGRVLGRAVD